MDECVKFSSKDVRRLYKEWSSVYDNESNPLISAEQPHLEYALSGIIPSDGVLEVGCGTGRITEILAKRSAHTFALDQSEAMMSKAKERLRRLGISSEDSVRCLEWDVTEGIPFSNGEFDWTVSALVSSHMPNLERFLTELVRVTRPGGSIVLSDLHPEANIFKHEYVGMLLDLREYSAWNVHTIPEWKKAIARSGARQEWSLEASIGPANEHCFTRECYREVQGEPYAIVYSLLKPQ